MGLRLLIKSLSNYSHVKLFNSHRTLTYNFKKLFRIISLNVWKFIFEKLDGDECKLFRIIGVRRETSFAVSFF